MQMHPSQLSRLLLIKRSDFHPEGSTEKRERWETFSRWHIAKQTITFCLREKIFPVFLQPGGKGQNLALKNGMFQLNFRYRKSLFSMQDPAGLERRN